MSFTTNLQKKVLRVQLMQIKLDDQQQIEIKTLVSNAIKAGIEQAKDNERPYLTRKEAAIYFGVAPNTLTNWASLGMPVAIVDGRKLYGKKSITNWLASHEVTAN